MKQAVQEKQTSNRSIRSIAEDYKMSCSTLQIALQHESGTITLKKNHQGRRTALSHVNEEAIADILISCARGNFGFGLADIVREGARVWMFEI